MFHFKWRVNPLIGPSFAVPEMFCSGWLAAECHQFFNSKVMDEKYHNLQDYKKSLRFSMNRLKQNGKDFLRV